MYKLLFNTAVIVVCLLFSTVSCSNSVVYFDTEKASIKSEILAAGLNHPWSLVFLPSGDMLVTERSGQLLRLEASGKTIGAVSGVPKVASKGQGGLLDIVLHPDYSNNQLVYFSYSGYGDDSAQVGTEVARAKLVNLALVDKEVVFTLDAKSSSAKHFGSRLVFNRENQLFITVGDRGTKSRAQDISDHAGSVIRIEANGDVPADNPFINKDTAKPEIFSYGHRNPQGAFLHPETLELWVHEHGPQGGDELNIVRAGRNYGWPLITYGANYGSGTQIGEGTEKEGMEQPLYYWVPSIAPSGMAFYSSDHFPSWKGNLFVGSLKFHTLVRLELEGETVVHEERILKKQFGRIRDVKTGPDGNLYLLTDSSRGTLVRLSPSVKE